ncbi:MAG: AbrB/MazE/SpoVT family DNA-binding domain-containing protein [Anaerolineae bacterium]
MAITMPMRAKVSTKGWVVIPAPLRKKYGLEPGSTVEIFDAEGRIILLPGMKDPIEGAHGMLAEGPSLTQELLAERAKELEREEAKLRR